MEGLAGEELLDAGDPEVFDLVEVRFSTFGEPVEQGDVVSHVAHTAAACAPALRSQHASDPVPLEDRLDGAPAQSEHLAWRSVTIASGRGKPRFAGVIGDDKRDGQRAFPAEIPLLMNVFSVVTRSSFMPPPSSRGRDGG